MPMHYEAMCREAFLSLGTLDPDERRNHQGRQVEDFSWDSDSSSESSDSYDSNSTSRPAQISQHEKFEVMYEELMRKPSDQDLVAMAKAQVRDEWFTNDGEVFYYREMQAGKPELQIPSSRLSTILFTAEYALRDLVYRKSHFDTLLLPQLEAVLANESLSKERKVKQLLFIRHHHPVSIRPRVGKLVVGVPFAESFYYEWERARMDRSDVLINLALERLGDSPVLLGTFEG